MDKAAVLEIIKKFGCVLNESGIHNARIVLYGSYARGDWHEWSDIDLIVISEDFADKGFWERIDILTEAIFKLHEPIEAVAMTPEEWKKGDSMIAQFAREGEEVYSA